MVAENEAIVEALDVLEAHGDVRRAVGQFGMAEQMAECVAVLVTEIERLRAALGEIAIADVMGEPPVASHGYEWC